jgi:hypothetical protein
MKKTFQHAMVVCAAVALSYFGAGTVQEGLSASFTRQLNQAIDQRNAAEAKVEAAVKASLPSENEVTSLFRGLKGK